MRKIIPGREDQGSLDCFPIKESEMFNIPGQKMGSLAPDRGEKNWTALVRQFDRTGEIKGSIGYYFNGGEQFFETFKLIRCFQIAHRFLDYKRGG